MVCAVGSFKLVFYQLQIFSCQSRRAAGRDDAAAVEYKTTNTLQKLEIQWKYCGNTVEIQRKYSGKQNQNYSANAANTVQKQ